MTEDFVCRSNGGIWFAWYPVKLKSGKWTWLKRVRVTLCEFGSCSETYDFWYEYEGLNDIGSERNVTQSKADNQTTEVQTRKD